MCVILKFNQTNENEKSEILKAFVANPDGFAIMQDEKIHKGLTLKELNLTINKLNSSPCIVWTRIATSGGTNKENLQPFKITTKEKKELYLFHNGVCGKGTAKKSDTRLLAESLCGCDEKFVQGYLSALNSLNKGKFILCDIKQENFFQIGLKEREGVLRSNENHLPSVTSVANWGVSRWHDKYDL